MMKRYLLPFCLVFGLWFNSTPKELKGEVVSTNQSAAMVQITSGAPTITNNTRTQAMAPHLSELLVVSTTANKINDPLIEARFTPDFNRTLSLGDCKVTMTYQFPKLNDQTNPFLDVPEVEFTDVYHTDDIVGIIQVIGTKPTVDFQTLRFTARQAMRKTKFNSLLCLYSVTQRVGVEYSTTGKGIGFGSVIGWIKNLTATPDVSRQDGRATPELYASATFLILKHRSNEHTQRSN